MVHLSGVQNLVEPAENYEQQPQKSSLLKKYNIPLHYLDFGYVEKCDNDRELEKILHVLQSGEEGHYPQLIDAVESKIALLKPNSKYLRKHTSVLSHQHLPKEEQNVLNDDLSEFLKHANKNDSELKDSCGRHYRSIPSIRASKTVAPIKVDKPPSSRIKSTDYESWDRYDVDTEILKLDLNEQKLKDQSDKENRKVPKLEKKCVRFNEFTTDAEAAYEAEREREKGNEYYKAGEYENAHGHYTRSISYKPSVAAYTNRALVSLKQKNYKSTITDCEKALKYEPNNIKAHLRLGQAYEGLKEYQKALEQAETVIQLEPNNTIAQTLANKVRPYTNFSSIARKTTRMKIIEIEDEPSRDSTIPVIKIKPKSALKPASKSYEIIPVPGTSKMRPPYYKRVDSTNPEIVRREVTMVNNVPQLLHITNICHGSDDDDDDCAVIHINPKKRSNKDSKSTCIISSIEQRECFENTDHRKGDNVSRNNVLKPVGRSLDKTIHCNSENVSINACTVVSKIEELSGSGIGDGEKSGKTDAKEKCSNKSLTDVVIIDKREEDNKENINSKGNLKINMNPTVEVLAKRTSITAAAEDKGASGEPYVKRNSNNDIRTEDIHMPYIFLNTWNCIRPDLTFSQHASVLRTLDLRALPRIIGCKLDGTMFSEIIHTVYKHLTVADEVWRVRDVMIALPQIQRFRIVVMFMNDQDKVHLRNILQFLEQHDSGLSDDIKSQYIQN